MAKTRMLKHDLRTSEKVASWPIDVRYFWVLLWGYVDDHGKAKDNPLLVKADTFPLDPDVTGDVIDGWLWLLVDAGVIARYKVAGCDYLQIVNWKEHQKPPHPTADILPSASDPLAEIRALHASRMKDAGTMPEDFTPVLGLGLGLVRVVSEVESSPTAMESAFEDAYSHWPKKVERKDAFEKFKAKAKRVGADELAEHVIRFGNAYAATTDKQFTPALGVWLGHERWTDELPTSAPRKETRGDSNLDYVRGLYADEQRQQMEIQA
jgi:hypothetical protein